MAIEMRQQMKLSQQLVMTPQLQQAIKLLQLSRIELQDLVSQELEENPVLDESLEIEEIKEPDTLEMTEKETAPQEELEAFSEVKAGEDTLQDMDWATYLDSYNYSSGEQYYDEDDDRPSYENLLTKKTTLFDHLLWQLKLSRVTEQEILVGSEIIGNIDEEGYLRSSLADIAESCSVDESFVESVLTKIQEFDPIGVGARNLQECLLLQVKQLDMEGSVVEAMLREHLKDLEQRKYKQIAKALGIDFNEVLAAAKIIAGLDPKPGRQFSQEDVHYISADIFVYKVGEEFVVVLNDEGMPNIRINPLYTGEARAGSENQKAEEYINEKMRSALWLIKSIHQRQRTIYRVSKSIVKFQRNFFERGIAFLKPLVLRDIAEDIGMHESTISRVTTNKYMQTPQGLLELKFFFNSGISTVEGDAMASESVKNIIKEIVDGEDPRKPLSDQRIAEILSTQNINIARRTITKYREMLKIGSSSERKRLF
ncbi:MAG: RNA polymerase sigma-54 factor [Deltaproteobacteria bacterium]|nr:RNA polymerase sigma-54 factor [Deltaproteobacteria bacterium]TLN03091.1 MAG: RNA polymerase factor sigma-54 [bacterium]